MSLTANAKAPIAQFVSGLLIERNWYALGEYHLQGNACEYCGQHIAGHFGDAPGTWGPKREAVDPAELLHQLESSPSTMFETGDRP